MRHLMNRGDGSEISDSNRVVLRGGWGNGWGGMALMDGIWMHMQGAGVWETLEPVKRTKKQGIYLR